jgi:hypothetical protein
MRTNYVLGDHIVTPEEAAAHTIEVMAVKPYAIDLPRKQMPQPYINGNPVDVLGVLLCGDDIVINVNAPITADDLVTVFFNTAVTVAAKTFAFESAMNDTKNLAVRFAGYVIPNAET